MLCSSCVCMCVRVRVCNMRWVISIIDNNTMFPARSLMAQTSFLDHEGVLPMPLPMSLLLRPTFHVSWVGMTG